MKKTEIGSKIANINTKNNSLSTMLSVMDQKQQNHKKVILLIISLTLRRCYGGNIIFLWFL